eukprot:794153_1
MVVMCISDSVLPTWVSIGFIFGSGLTLVITSWFSFKYVSSHSKSFKSAVSLTKDAVASKWADATNRGKLRLWLFDIWKRKSVYVPLMAHLSDTATDFAAVVEFGQIATKYPNSSDQCGINVWFLFGLSMGAMVLYRIVSSITIWRITQSWKRVISQLIDIELFQILWLSHRLGLHSKSSPQRLISVMEAVFESAPQTLIQVIYLLKTQRFSGIIVASSILSFINLTITIIGDDKQFLNMKFALPWKNIQVFSRWICLYLFRILDIPSTLLIYVFTWYYMDGYTLTALIIIDTIVVVICFVITKCTDALLSVVALPFSFGNSRYRALLAIFYVYSLIRNLVMNGLIWTEIISLRADFDYLTLSSALWLYGSVASVLKYLIIGVIFKGFDVWESFADASKERNDISRLLASKYWEDALELIFYKRFDVKENAKALYCDSAQVEYSLLSIAARCKQHKHLFDVILSDTGLDSKAFASSQRYETALISACRASNQEHIQMLLSMADYAYVMKVGHEKRTALYYAISSGRSVDVFKEHVDRILKKQKPYEGAIIQLLDNTSVPDQTALFVACGTSQPLSVFKSLYEWYPKEYQTKALSARFNGQSLLEICKKNQLKNIESFMRIPEDDAVPVISATPTVDQEGWAIIEPYIWGAGEDEQIEQMIDKALRILLIHPAFDTLLWKNKDSIQKLYADASFSDIVSQIHGILFKITEAMVVAKIENTSALKSLTGTISGMAKHIAAQSELNQVDIDATVDATEEEEEMKNMSASDLYHFSDKQQRASDYAFWNISVYKDLKNAFGIDNKAKETY